MSQLNKENSESMLMEQSQMLRECLWLTVVSMDLLNISNSHHSRLWTHLKENSEYMATALLPMLKEFKLQLEASMD